MNDGVVNKKASPQRKRGNTEVTEDIDEWTCRSIHNAFDTVAQVADV